METGKLLALAGLALVDSTSIGTLVLPLWMMLNPTLRLSRFLTYVGTVVGLYFTVGVLLVLGAGSVERALAGAADLPALNWAQLVVGVGLFALSFRYDRKRVERRRARNGGVDRASRWRERITGADATNRTMVLLGLAAAGMELASMLPYLAAIGLISTAGLGPHQWLPLLLGYVLVMVLPTLLLLTLRLAARRHVEPWLARLGEWMTRHTAGALGWVLGIVGFLLAVDAAGRLQLSLGQ